MISVYSHYYRDDLLKLAETIQPVSKRITFVKTIAERPEYQVRARDGQVVIRLSHKLTDAAWVADLNRSAGFPCRMVEPEEGWPSLTVTRD